MMTDTKNTDSHPSEPTVSSEVYAPDGTLLAGPSETSLADVRLPVSGTYRLVARRTLGAGFTVSC